MMKREKAAFKNAMEKIKTMMIMFVIASITITLLSGTVHAADLFEDPENDPVAEMLSGPGSVIGISV